MFIVDERRRLDITREEIVTTRENAISGRRRCDRFVKGRAVVAVCQPIGQRNRLWSQIRQGGSRLTAILVSEVEGATLVGPT